MISSSRVWARALTLKEKVSSTHYCSNDVHSFVLIHASYRDKQSVLCQSPSRFVRWGVRRGRFHHLPLPRLFHANVMLHDSKYSDAWKVLLVAGNLYDDCLDDRLSRSCVRLAHFQGYQGPRVSSRYAQSYVDRPSLQLQVLDLPSQVLCVPQGRDRHPRSLKPGTLLRLYSRSYWWNLSINSRNHGEKSCRYRNWIFHEKSVEIVTQRMNRQGGYRN